MFVSSLIVLLLVKVDAFTTPSFGGMRPKCLALGATQVTGPKPSELLRARMGAKEERAGSKVFDDFLLNDMQDCLVMIEKRVKGGPGSLSAAEVAKFDAAGTRVLRDMMERAGKLPARLMPGERRAAAESAATQAAAQAEANGATKAEIAEQARVAYDKVQSGTLDVETAVREAAHSTASSAAPKISVETAHSTATHAETKEPETIKNASMDISNDEGPEYTGTGGLGLAQETRNTYVIPGMDEMTAEEYQQALGQSIIKRQKERRMSGSAGNRGSWDYMNYLSGGKDTSILSGKNRGGSQWAPNN